MTRDELCAVIPHAGDMCLLEELVRWDAQGIVCRSRTHLAPANPLRDADGLPAISAVEYAAQAMAVHGALKSAASAPPKAGYLAALREVRLYTARLDATDQPLLVEAQYEAGDEAAFLYAFSVRAGDRLLAAGKALVVHERGGAQ